MRNSTGRYRRSAKLCKTNDQADERVDSQGEMSGVGRSGSSGGKDQEKKRRRTPLTAPKVEQATKKGMIQAMLPYNLLAKVCENKGKSEESKATAKMAVVS
ncbi:hypothetical protein E2C01_020429 [Portunus trituberculatus]|uniref:Uncharacterized protein n=1 Tax=Portunus trituberculatus TaxID=210409 RepID=A0A5B7DZR1_PORTR|nr:hypothetical protein [Portunus trituberculatus]